MVMHLYTLNHVQEKEKKAQQGTVKLFEHAVIIEKLISYVVNNSSFSSTSKVA